MDSKKMHYLLKIAELQSVTEASRQLFVSQPALSQVIHYLEKEYQIKIFHRKDNRLLLTPAGQILVDSFRQELRIEENMERQLNDVKQELVGTISVGLSHARAAQFLPVILPDFTQRYPRITLNINTNSSAGLENIVADGKLDFAFVMDSALIPHALRTQLCYEPLFRYHCLLAVPPSHPIAEETGGIFDWTMRPPIDLLRVKDEPFIRLAKNTRTTLISQDIFDAYGFEPIERVVLTDESLTCQLVAAGIGFALLQEHHALAFRKGVFFRLDKPNTASNLCLIYRKDTYLSQPARYFIQLVKEHTALGTWLPEGTRGMGENAPAN